MTRYTAQPRGVLAAQIIRVEPLMARNTALLSPDQGLLLVLDSGEKHKWLSEPNAPVPQIGDAFVVDSELGVSLIVPAAKFGQLFEAVSEQR